MLRGVTEVALVLSLATGLARAEQGPRVSLRWNAPDACPDDAGLVRAVEGFLDQSLAESREQQLAVNVSVQGSAGGFSAKLSFLSPQGAQQRFLEHPECNKLMEASALLVALAIDPERVKARQQAESPALQPAPTTASTTTPESTPPAVTPSAPARRPAAAPSPRRADSAVRPSLRPTMAVSGFVGAGPLPSISSGVASELGLRYRWFRAALIGRYWAPADAGVSGFDASSIRLSLATFGLRACGLRRAGDWSVMGCLGGDFGSLSGTGQGVSNSRTRTEPFATAVAGVSVAYSRWQLAPLAGFELSGAATRPRFGVLEAGVERESFQPAYWGVLGLVGVALGL